MCPDLCGLLISSSGFTDQRFGRPRPSRSPLFKSKSAVPDERLGPGGGKRSNLDDLRSSHMVPSPTTLEAETTPREPGDFFP